MADLWGGLIPDIWRLIAERFLSQGALRKLSLLNTKLNTLARMISANKAHQLEFVHSWQPQPKTRQIFSGKKRSIIFSLFSDSNTVLVVGVINHRTTFNISQLHWQLTKKYLALEFGNLTLPKDIACIKGDRFVVLTSEAILLLDQAGKMQRVVMTTNDAYRVAVNRSTGICAVSLNSTVGIYSADMEPLRNISCALPSAVGISNDNMLFVISGGGHINTFNLDTYEEVKRFSIPTSLMFAIDGVGTIALFNLGLDKLHFFSRDGEPLRKFTVEGTKRAIVIARGDLILLTDSEIVQWSEPRIYEPMLAMK